MLRRWTLLIPLAAALALWGCKDGDNSGLQERLNALEQENKQLHKKVEELTDKLRPLERKVHEVEQMNRHLDTTLGKVDADIRSRIGEMIRQERGGRRGFMRPPAAVPDRPREPEKPRPYMGFDGQTVTEELAKELKLKATVGVLVTAVREGAPAQVAGLKKDDVVQTLDGVAIRTKTELLARLAKKQPGDVVALAGLRADAKFGLKIKLGRR